MNGTRAMMPPPETINVLAVDDNPTDLILLRRALERSGKWQVTYMGVNTIEEAEALLCEGRMFDLGFMDYRLGSVDGVEGIRRLRSLGHRFPFVMLTGQGDERIAAASRRNGASDYLCKDDLTTGALDDSLRYVIAEYKKERRQSKALKEALTDGLTGLFVKD
jgi:DNA-binding NarL/FixJ family response regulator